MILTARLWSLLDESWGQRQRTASATSSLPHAVYTIIACDYDNLVIGFAQIDVNAQRFYSLPTKDYFIKCIKNFDVHIEIKLSCEVRGRFA
jgi:CO dehydrogenase/acetyl-CoA synthase delta subunit